jgi:Rod binding domain-containing protein
VPALESLHESPLRPTSGPFSSTSVERRFGPLLDQQFADRVAKAGNFKLVDAIVNHFSKMRRSEVRP